MTGARSMQTAKDRMETRKELIMSAAEASDELITSKLMSQQFGISLDAAGRTLRELYNSGKAITGSHTARRIWV